jgi:microcystin-dependent protein
VSGIITATSFSGSGASLITLNASNISSGTLPDARFPATLPAVSGANLTGISGIPSGTIIYHSTSTAPTGYLKANGASLSTTTYATLFAVIGYTYGGSGASFTLPDLRGQFIRSWADNGTTYDTGRTFGSSQTDDFKNHQHEFGADDQVGPQGSYTNLGSFSYDATSTTSGGGGRLRTRDDTTNFGTTETRPRNIALLACIKY